MSELKEKNEEISSEMSEKDINSETKNEENNKEKNSQEESKQVENDNNVEEDDSNKEDGNNKWFSNNSMWGFSMMNKALNTTMKKTMETFESVKSDFSELSKEINKQMTSTTEALSKQVENISNIIDNQLGIDEKSETEEDEEVEEKEKPEEPFSLVPPINFEWVSKITDTVKKTLTIEDTTEDEENFEKEVVLEDENKYKLDKIHFSPSLSDGKIFLQGMDNDFEKFCDTFELEDKVDEISAILSQKPDIADKYSRLVPNIMDELGFWMRYYYEIQKIKASQKNLTRNESSEDDSDVIMLPSSNETTKTKESLNNEEDETWSVCSSAKNE
uniref:BSD domain-containing protein n=1 Tax=Strongyloides papillosus TaxID=174720 RepID=A0A0N5BU82_STREA